VSALRGRRIRILGGDDRATAYAVVNAEWRKALETAGCVVRDHADADVLIHHDYSVRFGDATLPRARRRVAVRPWDFGPYPPRWVEVIEQQYDELWVFTRWARECAIRGGLGPDRIRVVPHGVDLQSFTPDGPIHPLTTARQHTVLFVGAAIDRKGADIAVRAFEQAFTDHDDVQLVVKDHTADVFYEGLSRRDDVLAAAVRPGAPSIRYVDEYVSRPDLAALYRGATVLVHPARAEGWALPVLEALASGTPVIVPRFGPFLDYCQPPSAQLVERHRIRAPVRRDFLTNTLGFHEWVESVDFCEPDVAAVARALQAAFAWSPSERTERRLAARAVAEDWSWERTTATMVNAIEELLTRGG
jgi:glycosyltransferase involved in cell wall biosynthesis